MCMTESLHCSSESITTLLIGYVCAKSLQLCLTFATLWTIACQALLSMGFSRQEYCSGMPCPPPENLPDLGIELVSCIGRQVLYH